jgi:hypothetical protein
MPKLVSISPDAYSNEAPMTASTTAYTIGRGKPPLHTRFQKGQSGNPSGKPGPAKLAKMRFQRELCAALEAAPEELALSKPATALAAMARRMVLDAGAGRGAAQRLVLSRLDAGCAREDEEASARERNEADAFSLVQGESQGGGEKCLEDILWPDGFGEGVRVDDDSRAERALGPVSATCVKERNEADPLSLVQGESQGGGEDSTATARQVEGYPSPATAQVSSAVPARLSLKGRWEYRCVASATSRRGLKQNEVRSFSLVQGKTQGSGENLMAPICAALAAEQMPAAARGYRAIRAWLMIGSAAAPSGDGIRFRLPPGTGRT